MPASERRPTEQKKLAGIFISYRRSDNPDATGRIYDRLVSEFGKARVFKDVDSIPLGQDFRGHLNDIVGGCAAVLAIVGPRWIDIRNEAGARRLEDPDDFVRIELEAALARSVPVVPVLVGHAPMPGTSQLPSTLSSLAFRQSIEVRPDPDFHNDATRLVSALRAIIDPNAPQVAQVLARPRRSWVPWLVGLAAATTLAAIAFAIPAMQHLQEAPAPETRTEISTQAQLVAGPSIALSPDGRYIVFAAVSNGEPRLWIRSLAATTAQPLPGTEGATNPFWSTDSRSIGFFTNDALKRLDVNGGAPLTLATVTYGTGGSWNSDGTILFSQFGKGVGRIAATGGAVTQVVPLEQGTTYYALPKFLPDGRRFLYLSAGGKSPGIYLRSLDGAAPVRLTPSLGVFAYLPSGWLLIWDDAQRVLVAQRLADKGALVGAPVILAEGSGAVSTSVTGLVAYSKSVVQGGKRQLKWRSRAGAELGSIGEPDEMSYSPAVAPDGHRVAVSRGESTNKLDIWLLDGERASRLTFDATGSGDSLWSPDGTRILFSSQRADAPGIYQKPADGAGEEKLILRADLFAAPTSWSADGTHLLYVNLGTGTNMDLGDLPMTGGRKSWMLLNSSFVEGAGVFSPDGKWVAYTSNESTRNEVYIRPFDAAGPTPTRSGKWQVSTAGGIHPKWNPNGKELFFLNPAGDMMAAPIIVTGSALTPGAPVKLFQTRVFGSGTYTGGPQYDVTHDGRFLINTVLDDAESAATPIILIQNWNPAGK